MPVPAGYVHADHIDVGAAVPDMGNHLIDFEVARAGRRGSPEFTHTFIFGAYDGQVTFYEPMITLALSTDPARSVRADQAATGMGDRRLLSHYLLHPPSRRRRAVHRVARGFRPPDSRISPGSRAPAQGSSTGEAGAACSASLISSASAVQPDRVSNRTRLRSPFWGARHEAAVHRVVGPSEPSWKVPNHSSSGIEPSA